MGGFDWLQAHNKPINESCLETKKSLKTMFATNCSALYLKILCVKTNFLT